MAAIIPFIVVPVLFSFLYRFRGGPFSFGSTFSARLVWWAIPNGFLFFVVTLCNYAFIYALASGITAGLCAYLGLLIPHSKGQQPGLLSNSLMGCSVAARSFLIVAPQTLLYGDMLYWFPIWGFFAGLLAYMAGYALHNKAEIVGNDLGDIINIFGLPQKWKKDVIARGGSEWGELFNGGLWGFGLLTLFFAMGML